MEINKVHKKYVRSIMKEISVYGKRKKEIEQDLMMNIIEKENQNPGRDFLEYMDSPDSIASEFRENLGLGEVQGFEYKSERKLFNLPLIHINLKRNAVAKGIIAIGPVATGFISIGAVAVGFLSFGAFSFGILAALGAVTISGLLSVGAVALSIGMSVGAVAMANYYAIGSIAQANIAIGYIANGTVSIFMERGLGDFMIQLPADRIEIRQTILSAYPTLSQFWQNLVLLPF